MNSSFSKNSSISCILEPKDDEGGLYLGDISAANDLESLAKHNIRCVLTVAEGTGLKYSRENVNFHEIYNVKDMEDFDISQYFDESFEYLERHRRYTSILVHCFAGVSRSATLVIAYLMRKNNWGYDRAFAFVKEKRNRICPNSGFVKQLRSFDVFRTY
jgi:predicted protein tyrosine phosphatase